jgi:hypothetical protein
MTSKKPKTSVRASDKPTNKNSTTPVQATRPARP